MEQGDKPVPQSPRPTATPQPLDPREQAHEDYEHNPQPPTPGSMQQRGATEQEVAPTKPLTQAPVNDERDAAEDEIDPRDELTPG